MSTVEGLYCKRPIQCLASSEIFTSPPPPHRPASVYPPPFGARVGHTRWVERGCGVNSSEDARHCSVLYICKYFVMSTFLIMIDSVFCTGHSVIKKYEIRENTVSKVCYSFFCSAGNKNVPLFLMTFVKISFLTAPSFSLYSIHFQLLFLYFYINRANIQYYIFYPLSTVPSCYLQGFRSVGGLLMGCRAEIRTRACRGKQADAQLSELRRTLRTTAHPSEPRHTLYILNCEISENNMQGAF
jgi:hypothetical protein